MAALFIRQSASPDPLGAGCLNILLGLLVGEVLGVAPQQRGVDQGGGGEHGDLGQRLPGLQPHPQQVRPDLRGRRG